MTIHDFDMARYVTGSEVVEVFARGAVRIDPAIAESGDIDTAVVMLVHESGGMTMIDNSRQAVYGYDQRVEAFGSAGHRRVGEPASPHGHPRTAAGTNGGDDPYFFLDRYVPSTSRSGDLRRARCRRLRSPVGAADGRAPLVMASPPEARWTRTARSGATRSARPACLASPSSETSPVTWSTAVRRPPAGARSSPPRPSTGSARTARS